MDGNDEAARQQLIEKASRRASKWMSYQNTIAEELQGQVGGLSKNKRRMMRLAPDYVMKHVRPDHRGFREVAFYEAVKAASSQSGSGYASRTEKKFLGKFSPVDLFDMLSMWLAIHMQDPVVAQSEQALIRSWKYSKKEAELLRRLSNFIPAYYGVVTEGVVPMISQSHDDDHEPCLSDAFILMQDVTSKFAKPCAIDIKMGTQTYEPDACEDKCRREYEKYPLQAELGMRIVSFRVYDPTSPDSDDAGYRSFPKAFGRGLESRAELLSAFRLFFSNGTEDSSNQNEEKGTEGILRKRVITNMLMHLKLLRSWFDDNDCISFYASSLFLVYDGDPSRGDATSTKLIDFGHVRREAGGDPGYKLGLRTLISLLTSLLEEAQPSAIGTENDEKEQSDQ